MTSADFIKCQGLSGPDTIAGAPRAGSTPPHQRVSAPIMLTASDAKRAFGLLVSGVPDEDHCVSHARAQPCGFSVDSRHQWAGRRRPAVPLISACAPPGNLRAPTAWRQSGICRDPRRTLLPGPATRQPQQYSTICRAHTGASFGHAQALQLDRPLIASVSYTGA